MKNSETHLASLNPAQREAVQHHVGPMLILAGAGAGKTNVITHRILDLILSGVEGNSILAVTFTNKAAKELKERIRSLIERSGQERVGVTLPIASTFHSLGVQILKEHARLLGLTRHFTIYDRADSARAVKEAIEKAGEDPKQFEPRRLLGSISKQKGNGVTLSQFRERAQKDFFSRLVERVWSHYEGTLIKEKALDFDDLLLKVVSLFRSYPDVLEYWQNRFAYIHVDEYQDINAVQYELVSELAKKHRNICVVGDIDQNIYSWRGADLEHMLNFERAYPDAKVVVLEQNYRSTKRILRAANEIIKKNIRRKEKKLFTENEEGERPSLYVALSETDEGNFIATRVRELLDEKVSPSQIALLFRANFQSRAIEEAMLANELPYQLVGVKFFERKEVKDILSYLRLALNTESLGDLRRVINSPTRGIGKITLLKILSGKESELTGSVKEKVSAFRNLIERVRETATHEQPSAVVRFIITESGIEKNLREGSDEDLERLENIRELVSLAARYDGLPLPMGVEKLLEEAALQTDQDELAEEKDAVRLMTVHASKGLEFDYVFVTGLEEGLFPHERLDEEKIDDEEERRLFYVALTRARKKVFLSYASTRTVFGTRQVNLPSKFLIDLGNEHLEPENMAQPRRTIYLDD